VRLTVLEDWLAKLGAGGNLLGEVEKEIKDGGKAYLYFIRDC